MVKNIVQSPGFWAIVISAVLFILLPKDKLYSWFDELLQPKQK